MVAHRMPAPGKSPRILFLIPYFGRWPFWMPFFLESCRHNSDIDWLFFTDCGRPESAPPNVRFLGLGFDDYCQIVSRKLGISFAPSSPYKLCDLKPALGLVHQEYLQNYDYWGFSDIDLIYGELRNYFTEQRMAGRDLLSTHERRISGHLCLLRNSPEMLNCFRRVPDWERLLANDKHAGFDEGAFSRLFVRFKNWPKRVQQLLSLGNPLWRNSEFHEAFTTPYGRVPWHDGSFDFPDYWRWDNGKLTNSADGARSFPYFHFIGWKQRADWRSEAAQNSLSDPGLPSSGCWHITPTGFRACPS
jgi:hypothetical protein